MTRKYYSLTLSAYLLAVTLVFLVAFAGAAWPASLRICITDPLPNPDVVTAPAFINGDPLWPDLLSGSIVTTAGRCNTVPIPAVVVRGTDQAVTVKYTNSLQEVGPASNARSFRLPNTPPQPVVNSVQIVVP